jgi:tRNA(Ile)-lysidine synthase
VRQALKQVKGDLRGVSFDHIAAILKMASAPDGHGRVQAPGVEVRRSLDWVRFVIPGADPAPGSGYRMPAPVPGTVLIPGTEIAISLELIEKAETLAPPDSVYNSKTDYVDWCSLSSPLEVRNWRAGDQYRPRGSSREEKIKTLFQEARIPFWERRNWPVLTDRSGIVWARQFGPAERLAAGPGSTRFLQIRVVGT